MDQIDQASMWMLDRGIGIIILAGLVILGVIYIPKIINMVLESKKTRDQINADNIKRQNEFYSRMQDQYNEQGKSLHEIVKNITQVAERGNIAIENSTRVIESNNKVISENQEIFKSVTNSIDNLSTRIGELEKQSDINRSLNNKILTKTSELDVKVDIIKEKISN